jgi:uncharacterized membrane protein YeaQ/YmgE (transglycosylase-associated protein family)
MTITLPELLLLILIAAIVGAIGRQIAGGPRGGLLVSIVVGFIGALLGPWIAHELRLSEPLMVRVDGHSFGILWSIFGAALFVALVHLASGRRRFGRRRRWV